MAIQRRRTEIQIETHEITIIRFGRIRPIDRTTDAETADVQAHGEIDPQLTPKNEKEEKEIQDETQY